MANLKNITDVPVVESAEGLNLIVNDNGAAKQIAASAVGAQADFNVTDESHPAFIKNKPAVAQADWNQNDSTQPDYIKNKPDNIGGYDLVIDVTDWENCRIVHGSHAVVKNKILNGTVPSVFLFVRNNSDDNSVITIEFREVTDYQYFTSNNDFRIGMGEDAYIVHTDGTVELYQN